MSVWYFLEKGRPRGPVNAEFILAEIRACRLQRQDLLYRERDTQWREVQFFAEFQPHLEQQKKVDHKSPAAKKEDRWVLLTRNTDGGGYRQNGPFTTAEIIRQLKNGKITITDYVWREGLKEWYKILAVPEIKEQLFDPDQQTQTAVPVPVPIPTAMPIPAVMPPEDDSVEVEPHEKGDAPPPDPRIAKNEDAKSEKVKSETVKSEITKPEVTKKVRRGRESQNRVRVEGRRMGAMTYFMDLPPVKRTIFGGILLVTVGCLVITVFWVSSYLDRRNVALKKPAVAQLPPEKIPAPVVRKPAPVIAKAKPILIQKIKKPPVIVLHPPTYLRVETLNNGRTNPIFRILTDASSQFAMQVHLAAEGGYVLNHFSYFFNRTVHLEKDDEIHLGRWHLPWGIYSYKIKCQKQSAAGILRVGTFQKSWPQKIRQQRKDEIFEHNYERIGYIRTANLLANVTKKLVDAARLRLTVTSWRTFYLGWREEFWRIQNPIMSRINYRNRERYLHPTQWMALHSLRDDIDRTSQRLNLAELRHYRDAMELDRELQEQAQKAENLKIQMIRTSIMR